MNTYFMHDGRNEIGPFTIDLLKRQKLTRNTPIRLNGTNRWLPAEKIPELKIQLVPRKIKRPKEIVLVMRERVFEFRRQRPKTAYALFVILGLLISISIYSVATTYTVSAGTSEEDVNAVEDITTTQPAVVAVEHMKAEPSGAAATTAVKKNPEKVDATKAARQQWQKLFRVSNSSYGIAMLGGIKNLKVIVGNRSDYPVDEAVAKVTYYKSNGDVWKSKLITLYGIAAHDSKQQSVPDVLRGKNVSVSLQKVVSRKMNFSYTAGKKGATPGDPYLLQ